MRGIVHRPENLAASPRRYTDTRASIIDRCPIYIPVTVITTVHDKKAVTMEVMCYCLYAKLILTTIFVRKLVNLVIVSFFHLKGIMGFRNGNGGSGLRSRTTLATPFT